MLGSNDMKNVITVLGDVMKLGALVHAFCSEVLAANWYKCIASRSI